MIRFETGNGTCISIPGGAPEDLELALELVTLSIRNEQRILSHHAKRLCTVLQNMARREAAGMSDENPVWCQDCRSFEGMDPAGCGTCSLHHMETWYGNCACGAFQPMKSTARSGDPAATESRPG